MMPPRLACLLFLVVLVIGCTPKSAPPPASPAASQTPAPTAAPTATEAVARYDASAVWEPMRRSVIVPLLTKLRAVCPADVAPAACARRPGNADAYAPLVTYFDLIDRMVCNVPDHDACVEQVMRDSGASAAAIDFYRASQGWVLEDFRDTGKIDVGVAFNRFRANSNTQWVLLNGSPSIWFPEQAKGLDISHDPVYPALDAAFPAAANLPPGALHIVVWPADYLFEAASAAFSGQRFTFQFTVNNFCHACQTGYFARFAFDFDANGVLQSTTPLGVCRGPHATVSVAGPPPCPAAE